MLRLLCRQILPMQPDILTPRLLSFTPSLPPLPPPSRRETHFWYLIPEEVKDASLLNQYMDILSPCERQNILQMNKDKVQKGAVLTRALVRTTLARYTDSKMSPRSFSFRKNRFGKPEVNWQLDNHWIPPSLHFNISHTSSLIACGVTTDVPIGIDVEEKQRRLRNNILSIARRYFSPSEVEFLHALADPECQRMEFIKLWTLKEAYVKALGRGFSAAPFRDFTIRLEATKEEKLPRNPETASEIVVQVSDSSESLTTNWQFALFDLDSSHYAAVCVERDGRTEDRKIDPLRLKVWRTLPLVGDECVLETDAVANIGGLN